MSQTNCIVNVCGKLVPPHKACVPIFDRGFLYGDSIYEVTLTQDGKPIFLSEHLQRLERSAQQLGIILSPSAKELENEVNKTIEPLHLPRLYIRIIVTRGEGEIGLDPNLSKSNNFFIIVKELPPYPEKWYKFGVQTIIPDIIRNPKRAIDPGIKSGNYLNNVMAMAQAREKGVYDAIMLNEKGLVAEGTTSNVWIVKDGIIITPPLRTGILGGITRQKLLEIGAAHGLIIKEQEFTPEQMKASDEAFFSSSTKEIIPIIKIDQTPIGRGGPGPLTQKLHQLYKNFVSSSLK